MKKILLVLFVLLIGSTLFAVPNNYPFGVVVFPCEFYGLCYGSETDSNYISSIVGNRINANKTMCSFCYNRQNEFMKWMMANDKLEAADLTYPVNPDDYERIASQMDVDGYVVIRAKDFKHDPYNYKAEMTLSIQIFKLGVEEPIYSANIPGKFTGKNGYIKKFDDETAYYRCFLSAGNKVKDYIKKFNATKYKDTKQAISAEERISQLEQY